jgi:hypothetical protein
MSAKRQMSGWLVAVAAAAPMDNDVRPCPTPALICGWLIRFAMTTLKPPQAGGPLCSPARETCGWLSVIGAILRTEPNTERGGPRSGSELQPDDRPRGAAGLGVPAGYDGEACPFEHR